MAVFPNGRQRAIRWKIDPEPRPGLRAGHIPGSKNVFYKDLLKADDTMKSPDEMRQVFLEAGVDLDKPVITSCGSRIDPYGQNRPFPI